MEFYTWCNKCGRRVSNESGVCKHCGTPHNGWQPKVPLHPGLPELERERRSKHVGFK